MNLIKTIIVDNHKLFREGVKFALSQYQDIEILGEAANGAEYLNMLSQKQPDIVLMDIDMPVMNGFEATQKSLALFPDLKIITLSMYGDQGHYVKMIELGVKGFVLKDSGASQLYQAIIDVHQGGNYFSHELLMNLILKRENTPQGEQLRKQLDISDRELEVLRLLCKAFSNKQIADELFISAKTVEGHKAKLMDKTNTTNSLALVLYAIKNKLVEI
jgi:DNA-binding NarL/FixJ family response regulator